MVASVDRELTICAFGTAALTYAEIQQQRRALKLPGRTLPAGFLKNAEEQTVAGFVALADAISRFELAGVDFSSWGVIGAPKFFGRCGGANAITRYETGGPSSTSVHIIPQQCLHSPSGAVSLAIGSHGPNFGTGGGPHAIVDGCMAALGTINWEIVSGTWLLLTEWSPEPVLNTDGTPSQESRCHALALALIRTELEDRRPRLRVQVPDSNQEWKASPWVRATTGSDESSEDSVHFLAQKLAQLSGSSSQVAWKYRTTWGAQLELVG